MPHPVTEAYVTAAPGVRLWTERRGDPDAPPLLLVMGAGASGIGWPEPLLDALAEHHHVIRYDHRDTGRSTTAYDEHPYPVTDLARDVVAVLDGLEVPRAHVAGLSLGGMLTQLVLADHPERLLSATLIGTCALSTRPYVAPDGTVTQSADLPPIAPEILEIWQSFGAERGPEAELDWRVEHWRALAGGQLPFDAAYFRDLERAVITHSGTHVSSTAHGRADDSGMLRTEALARNEVPTLVVSGTAEPVFPPPHPQHIAQVVGNARVLEVPGMGHALPPAVLGPLVRGILHHTRAAA
ncbi:alpha/beta fold hydrolase [Streptomyces sp. NRRL B-1347]|uniref:alpha/beta fold hydrolase n=1 Tax=Streptomyces sp. NRRL B-1347 TaxID=1476877 RepID=UPI0004C5AE83|nr:alpha/beta hydrolase [Streptomyces sp. NRRL B-1347]